MQTPGQGTDRTPESAKQLSENTIAVFQKAQDDAKAALIEAVKGLPFDQAYGIMGLAEEYADASCKRAMAPLIIASLLAPLVGQPANDPIQDLMGPLPLKDRG